MKRTITAILAFTLLAAALAAQPITFTDARNINITLPGKALRVVSLNPAMTEIIYAAGAGSRLVGNTTWCNYPAEAAAVSKIGGYSAQSISIEQIVALRPDLVLGEAGSVTELADAMENAGLRFAAVNLRNFEDIYQAISLVGRIAGDQTVAANLVASLRQRVANVVARVAGLSRQQRPVVYYEVWHEPLMTAGPNTFISQIITTAGGINCFADVDTDWPTISFEAIVMRNPTVIMASDTHGVNVSNDRLALRPGWSALTAVRTNNVALIDGDIISRPGPRFVDAIELVAARLFPVQF
ncbi:MAG: hypothetical protein A2087_14445 [Spirochaetes bacterium GWD1_61_31]|nr:MAG: hypothetical protein A2Y37_11095 [Spirochaetes bacterium GWB1_60_80]OHD35323.1 MAG: hypothetical protein A2004_00330 [Spirochaetes bacterium GWC1_61_12]OHD37290.1 MAG: hypothetical protein A2087_14445 [Spirochaetes bacterium GWD1_61_31]OHD44979.1 MAG: hypothetical protein A2Y35_13140 [Spirochaetes bacterium GWE1_60_18]OHD60088.1 MAG: hypothetical protein A2Y32_11250 [Spirochaetes bacterium GWF1_60_12]HAP43657.1 cobalamin-binding protein [Spirochaetaceae bacterium]